MTTNLKKQLKNWIFISLICTFWVILAGSIVRSSGSGMGCPDWPKCFGYYIPPYEKSQLDFQVLHHYQKNQMILWDNHFYKAKADFLSENQLNLSDWILFDAHTYTKYDPIHTYIEYFNRLSGAVLGLVSLILLFYAMKSRRKKLIIYGVLLIACIIFEAWLGAKVVESNLAPFKITLHMLFALIILYILIWMKKIAEEKKINLSLFSVCIVLLLLLQIMAGTMLREKVDVLKKSVEIIAFEDLGLILWIHIAGGCLIFMAQLFRLKQKKNNISNMGFVFRFLMIAGLFFSGALIGAVGLAFFQPIHLFLSLLFFTLELEG